jgi:molybdenum cofactor biosynthesis enzyme MoaA
MDRSCSTGKKGFSTQPMAVEALLHTHVHYVASKTVNVYQCELCNQWHLTSKGELHPELKQAVDDGTLQERIKKLEWERKYGA